MPVYKDEDRNTYYCRFYYTDWKGQKRQKCKRGFELQREAKEWERHILPFFKIFRSGKESLQETDRKYQDAERGLLDP